MKATGKANDVSFTGLQMKLISKLSFALKPKALPYFSAKAFFDVFIPAGAFLGQVSSTNFSLSDTLMCITKKGALFLSALYSLKDIPVISMKSNGDT